MWKAYYSGRAHPLRTVKTLKEKWQPYLYDVFANSLVTKRSTHRTDERNSKSKNVYHRTNHPNSFTPRLELIMFLAGSQFSHALIEMITISVQVIHKSYSFSRINNNYCVINSYHSSLYAINVPNACTKHGTQCQHIE